MKISVIIPTYNREKLLHETLSSIFTDLSAPIEVIVVDDNSIDGTISMLLEYAEIEPRLQYFKKPSGLRQGPSCARNFGVTKASGDYIMFFDSDDLLDATFFKNLIAQLKYTAPDVFLCKLKWFSENISMILGESGDFHKEDFISKGILQTHNFWTPNMIWKKSFLDRMTTHFDESLTMSEDIEFAIRMLTQTTNWNFSNDLNVYIRRHENSLTHRSNLPRECAIANSRFFAHKSILDVIPKESLTDEAKVKCTFIMRQSLLFLLKIKGVDKFFLLNFMKGFIYSPPKKWPGYAVGIIINLALYIRKGRSWERNGDYGRSF
jgi:glycosyltransferase involved in cell wall biosynthesis